MAKSNYTDWPGLPNHVFNKIFRCLTCKNAFWAARTCKSWFRQIQSPSLWRHVEFNFFHGFDRDKKQLDLIDKFGCHMRSVLIRLDQSDFENRLLATDALKQLSKVNQRQIQRLKIDCTGENPLFYKGQEFIEALGSFASVPVETLQKTLTHLDLSCLPIAITDELLYSFSSHFSSLQYLDIQNKQLICQVSPECIETVVNHCVKIRDLRLFHACLSESVLRGFCADNRQDNLCHISIMCRRQEKYRHDDLTDEAWQSVIRKNPKLRVTLKFDHTCPLWKVREIMKPVIPVANLFLETYTMIYPELEIATESYSETLGKVVIQTQSSSELDCALLAMSEKCHNLTSLHVMCTLDKDTISQILSQHPELTRNNDSCTLKSEMEPCPWVLCSVLDEINANWC